MSTTTANWENNIYLSTAYYCSINSIIEYNYTIGIIMYIIEHRQIIIILVDLLDWMFNNKVKKQYLFSQRFNAHGFSDFQYIWLLAYYTFCCNWWNAINWFLDVLHLLA